MPRMSLQPHSSKFLCYCTLLVVTKLQLAYIAVKFSILFINRTGAYHCWMNKIFLDFRLMKCKMWMLTELFFVFHCKENQERTNIELGEVKCISYQNPLIIVFIFTVAVLVPQMTCQPHSCISLYYCTLLGCHCAPVTIAFCYFIDEQDQSTSLADG